jgi:hypothetical protein
MRVFGMFRSSLWLLASGCLLAGFTAQATSIPITNSGFDAYNAGTSTLIASGCWLQGTGSGKVLNPSGTADFPSWTDNGYAWLGAQNQGSSVYTDLLTAAADQPACVVRYGHRDSSVVAY